jgi:drug/metabolite transporter (DMT)-like permease
MWVIYSLGATLLLALMSLVFKKLGNDGVPAGLLLCYLFAMLTVFSIGWLKYQGTPLHISPSALLWIAGAAVASFFGNLCVVNSLNLAPNPGYASAIEASKALIVVVASVWLFSSEFSFTKGLGALCCVIGVVLLSLPVKTPQGP